MRSQLECLRQRVSDGQLRWISRPWIHLAGLRQPRGQRRRGEVCQCRSLRLFQLSGQSQHLPQTNEVNGPWQQPLEFHPRLLPLKLDGWHATVGEGNPGPRHAQPRNNQGAQRAACHDSTLAKPACSRAAESGPPRGRPANTGARAGSVLKPSALACLRCNRPHHEGRQPKAPRGRGKRGSAGRQDNPSAYEAALIGSWP